MFDNIPNCIEIPLSEYMGYPLKNDVKFNKVGQRLRRNEMEPKVGEYVAFIEMLEVDNRVLESTEMRKEVIPLFKGDVPTTKLKMIMCKII